MKNLIFGIFCVAQFVLGGYVGVLFYKHNHPLQKETVIKTYKVVYIDSFNIPWNRYTLYPGEFPYHDSIVVEAPDMFVNGDILRLVK